VLGAKSLGLKATTLALSVSAHGAVALLAAHGSGAPTTVVAAPRVELPAPELVVMEAASAESSSSGPVRAKAERHGAHHKHPYALAADHDVTPHDPSLPHIPLPAPSTEHVAEQVPAVLEAPSTAPERFVLTVARGGNGPEGASCNGHESEAPSASATPVAEDRVDIAARLLVGHPPAYTPEAEAAGVEADVPVEIVVDDHGNVVSARAIRRVGYGLDEAALRSLRDYRFHPARRGGRPVAVRMRWLVRFELR
jgi:TonB family protein